MLKTANEILTAVPGGAGYQARVEAAVDAAILEAVSAERDRCAAIVQAARFGGERDFRSLVYMIENGTPADMLDK